MPYSAENDPLDLRHRAEEARVMAEGARDPGARKTFVGIAEIYEMLAGRAEAATLKAHVALGSAAAKCSGNDHVLGLHQPQKTRL